MRCCGCASDLLGVLLGCAVQSAALRGSGIRFIFIENICNDPAILQQNYLNKMMYSPDYKGIPTEKVGSGAQQLHAKHVSLAGCKGVGWASASGCAFCLFYMVEELSDCEVMLLVVVAST